MTKNSKLMIKSKSLQPLTLNEAFDSTPNNKKYIFSGVFTACSVPGHVVINRNNRSYPEKEVLRHLGYLREMIKQSGSILGELDHPEGRFDIQLKEASHKITDLWYDQENHNVMGKLEILDTPNGKIAQELVEAGYPLFVSSRAAGDVDEKTHEVEIAQIFTYDIVCTPGFAEARLDRINESLGVNTMSYLNESVSAQKSQKETTNKKYKVLMEGVTVNELEQEAPINEKCMEMKNKPINLKDLSKPLLEEDEEEFKLPEADVTPDGADNSSSDSDNKDDKSDDNKDNDSKSNDNKSEPTEEEKQKKRALIIDITSEDAMVNHLMKTVMIKMKSVRRLSTLKANLMRIKLMMVMQISQMIQKMFLIQILQMMMQMMQLQQMKAQKHLRKKLKESQQKQKKIWKNFRISLIILKRKKVLKNKLFHVIHSLFHYLLKTLLNLQLLNLRRKRSV